MVATDCAESETFVMVGDVTVPTLQSLLQRSVVPRAGIKKTDNSRFYSDLEFVRPIYFAKNVKKSVQKLTFFR